MRILGIETSCDETAIAIVEDGQRVKSSVIASSVEAFTATGGVIPEEAARKQIECIVPVLKEVLHKGEMSWDQIDAIAVTKGPGLLGSLLIGTVTSRALASIWEKPLIGVHHTLGHLSSTWLDLPEGQEPQFPILTLSASGGHTELWLRTNHLSGTLLGRTRDDAAGEAFDKGATLLGLPYPGGPSISKSAAQGDPHAFPFPLPLHAEDTLDFSFSGLKTALRYTIRDHDPLLTRIADLAASYEHALCHHLTRNITRALERHPEIREVHLVGGVSANSRLRTMAAALCGSRPLRFPVRLHYCTDNAAMIAGACAWMMRDLSDSASDPFDTKASLPLEAALVSSALPILPLG